MISSAQHKDQIKQKRANSDLTNFFYLPQRSKCVFFLTSHSDKNAQQWGLLIQYPRVFCLCAMPKWPLLSNLGVLKEILRNKRLRNRVVFNWVWGEWFCPLSTLFKQGELEKKNLFKTKICQFYVIQEGLWILFYPEKDLLSKSH